MAWALFTLSLLLFLIFIVFISIGDRWKWSMGRLGKALIPLLPVLILASLVGVSLTMGGEPKTNELLEIACQEKNDFYRRAAAGNIACRLDATLVKAVESEAKKNEKAKDSLTVISRCLEEIYKRGDETKRKLAMMCMEHAFRDDTAQFLLNVIAEDPSLSVRAAAAVALQKTGDQNCAEPVAKILLDQSQESELTEALMGCLEAFGNERAAEVLIDARCKLDDAQDPTKAALIDKAVVAVGEPSAPHLLPLLGGPRTTTAESILAQIGWPALKYLEAHIDLHKDEHAIRGAACIPLFQIHINKNPEVLGHMVNYLRNRDWNGAIRHVSVHYKAFIEFGIRGSEYYLIDALNAYGNIPMGDDYLNCGCDLLDQAARAWAARHGYIVVTTPGQHEGPAWGGY